MMLFFCILGCLLLPPALLGLVYTVKLSKKEGFTGTNRIALPVTAVTCIACPAELFFTLLPPRTGLGGFLYRGCCWFTGLLGVLYGAFLLFALVQRLRRPGAFTTLLVLGCGGKDGFASMGELEDRVNLAASLWKPGRVLLSTGGGEGETEAAVMTRLLTEKGIPPEALLREDCARSTMENLRLCRTLVRGRVLLVTSGYHVPRALLLAKTAGFREITGIGAKNIPFFYASFYEMLATMYTFLWLPYGVGGLFLLTELLRLLTR